VVVTEQGIVEEGAHPELLARGGVDRTLHDAQFATATGGVA
jgi:ABC-type multidrug transport system fused ATPase/permease subunit